MASPRESVNSGSSEDEQHEVQTIMTEVLYAVVVGLTLAATAFLAGLPDWSAPLAYVIGVSSTLLVRGSAAVPSARLPSLR